jgi:hypothetical protein
VRTARKQMRLSDKAKLFVLIFPLLLVNPSAAQIAPRAGTQPNREPESLAASSHGPTTDSYTSTIHERFAPFLTGDGFRSELLLQNIRLDVPVTVIPALILAEGELKLDPITLAPHSSATLDINSALLAHHLDEPQGVIVVRYDFKTYGAVSSGNLKDLALSDCTMGEIVTYPGTTDFAWPSPPFPANSSTSPTIIDFPAFTGGLKDDHKLAPSTTFVKPYLNKSFMATQFYRYKCSCANNGNYVNVLGPLTITRQVSQNSDGTFNSP